MMKARWIYIGFFGVLMVASLACSVKNSTQTISMKLNDSLGFHKWIGDYASDSMWLDSFLFKDNNQSLVRYDYDFAQYKISVQQDFVIFSHYVTGSVPVGLASFKYACTYVMKKDTLLIQTENSIEDYPLTNNKYFSPIRKPVLKFYRENGKIIGSGINYGRKAKNYLNIDAEDEEFSDVVEFHRVNYQLKHAKPQQ